MEKELRWHRLSGDGIENIARNGRGLVFDV